MKMPAFLKAWKEQHFPFLSMPAFEQLAFWDAARQQQFCLSQNSWEYRESKINIHATTLSARFWWNSSNNIRMKWWVEYGSSRIPGGFTKNSVNGIRSIWEGEEYSRVPLKHRQNPESPSFKCSYPAWRDIASDSCIILHLLLCSHCRWWPNSQRSLHSVVNLLLEKKA